MFDKFKNRLELTGTLTTVTALRISQGRSTEPIGSDLPVVKDALGQPLIPGSSFKGALRPRLESLLRGIHPELAQDPSELVSAQMSQTVTRIKQEVKEANLTDQALTDRLMAITDEVSKVFGAPWQAGKFQVRDLTVQPDTWFGQYQERDGVSIDRDTETAVDGRLYDFQVVPAGAKFVFRAVCENAEDWELGLIMLGLQQFAMQQIPLGGGVSRGLGVVQLDLEKMMWIEPNLDDSTELIDYMRQTVAGDLSSYEWDLSEDSSYLEAIRSKWTEALLNYLPLRADELVSAAVEA